MNKTEKVCAQCGERLRAGQRKYCSETCQRRARYLRDKQQFAREQKKVEKRCVQCGRFFETTGTNAKYCSEKCRNRAKVLWRNPEAAQAGEEAVCGCCGMTFVREKGNEKYCGAECRETMRGKHAREADRRRRTEVRSLRPGENAKAIVRAETAARAAGLSYGYSQLRRMGIV